MMPVVPVVPIVAIMPIVAQASEEIDGEHTGAEY